MKIDTNLYNASETNNSISPLTRIRWEIKETKVFKYRFNNKYQM